MEIVVTHTNTDFNALASLFETQNVSDLMERLPKRIKSLFQEISRVSDSLNYPTYVVGGFVRDLLLGKENFDIDIVVDGDGIRFAKVFSAYSGGKIKVHRMFKTAVVTLPCGFKLDIATARKETYTRPAALPIVTKGTIKDDLYRRDFTINAMAIQLNKKYFGNLIDFFSGKLHLKERIIKVLHNLSFYDDPTRIFRAVRFEKRHNFLLHEETVSLINKAMKSDVFKYLSKERFRDELILVLSEDNPFSAISRLAEFGVLKYIHPKIKITKKVALMFRGIQDTIFNLQVLIEEDIERFVLYFLCLVDRLSLEELQDVVKRFKFTKSQREKMLLTKHIEDKLIISLQKEGLSGSSIYKLLKGIPIEILIFIISKAEIRYKRGDLVKERIIRFIGNLRNVCVEVSGEDLKRLGIKPGPLYKEIIEELLYAKIDGKVSTKEEELNYIIDNFRDRW